MSEQIPTYPYPPRPGTSPEAPTPEFNQEKVLSLEARREVIAFEHQLYDLTLDPAQFPRAEAYRLEKMNEGRPMQSIESIWRKKVNSITLGVDYFRTDKGREALTSVTGLALEENASRDLREILADLDIREVPSAALDELQADSIGHEEDRLTQLFVESDFRGAGLPAPDIVTVYKNPHVILEKARGYRDMKSYLSRVIADLRNENAHLDREAGAAKLLVAELYRRRINRLLAATYVEGFKLLGQYHASGSVCHADIVSELENTLPAFFVHQDREVISSTLQRLDRFSSGVSVDKSGDFTWLSTRAKELAERADREETDEATLDRGPYADIDVDALNIVEIDGKVYGLWLESVLEEYGLLSEHREWDSEREGPAPDGKWQVIVDNKYKSLAVNGKQRVIKVPAKPTSVMAAVTVGTHEVTHVVQNENKRAVGELKILESGINLDTAPEQTESGGKWQEREARQVLTGKIDRDVPGTGYLKAIAVKAMGGSYGECVEVYYEDLLRRNPKMPAAKAAAMAVNRARRIFRSGGLEFAQDTRYVTNTQPLSYLEQQLIYEELGERRRKLLFIGGITVRNLERLAEKGLVDPQKIFIPEKSPWEIMYPLVKERILAATEER